MGDLEGRIGILADKECPPSANPFSSVIDIDIKRWTKAELRTAELICRIQPTVISEYRRKAVVQYVQRLIHQCIGCEVFTFGSVPLKTYLPDGDIDLSAFSKNQNVKNTWANEVRSVLEEEERNKHAEFRVKEVQYIHAEVKLVKCLIENIVVDISFNQLGGLCTLCFLEQVNRLIGRNHLFKRSIILVKAWCYYESRILGAHHGLISTYALETLVLYIFHLFHVSLRGPLEVLYRFLDYFSKFDWENYCVSIQGPVPISSLPEIDAESPWTDGDKVLFNKEFLRKCTDLYSVFPKGQDSQGRSFSPKYLNVVDPLRENNNLGRSVSKGNFYRIRSAFGYGARKLGKILQSPEENIAKELDNFFLNTWERHGSGQRPDVPDSVSCGLESKLAGESVSFAALSKSIVDNSKEDPKEIVSSNDTKAQFLECIDQSKDLTSDSGKLQKHLISSSVESMSPITQADGADTKINLFEEIKKVEALPVEIGSKVKGDLLGAPNYGKQLARKEVGAPNYGKQLARKEAGQHSESQAFSNSQPNQSSRALAGEGYPVTSGRLAGDAKDLASDNHSGPDISKRELSDKSKQRSSAGGDNCWPSANRRGKSTGLVPTNSKLHILPSIAKRGMVVEGNVNEEFVGRIACSEATISSHGSSLPSVEMYNSIYPNQPSLESGVVSFGHSGRTAENTNEVSRDESLKYQQTSKSTQTSLVPKENMEITTIAATACPRLESVPVGAMVDGLGSPRYDLLSSDFGNHLNNLAYGRLCQEPVLHGSMLPFTVVPPRYAHAREQGLWEGPGRPFHSNMNMPNHIRGHGVVSGNPFLHASGYLGANSAIFPGTFTGEELGKPRSGTGMYFPNLSHRSYRERFSANKSRHHQGTTSHDLTGCEGSSSHQHNNRHDSVPHWQAGYTDIDANTAAGKFGGSDISRHEIAKKSSYHPSSAPVMGDAGLTPSGTMTLYSSSHVTGSEAPTFMAVGPSGPPVVMLYPYCNGVTFPSGQVEFGSFGPLQFNANPRVRSGQGGSIGPGAPYNQSYTPGSAAPLSISNEKGLQQPAAPSKQEREAPQSYQLKEEDFPPLSFQGQHRGSATAAANDRGQSDRGSHCQAYVAASTL